MSKNKITLREFIDEVGVPRLAQHFCLERSTVRKWRDGSQIPKTLHMYSLVKWSGHRVTYDQMIEAWIKRIRQIKRGKVKNA